MIVTDVLSGPKPNGATPDLGHTRVAIVGTGFSGLGAAIKLKERGTDFVIFERSADLGGTWRDNSYPGCKCDVPSHLYSFSFAPNPDWSRTYSPQAEIWTYLRRCAEQFGIVEHIRFDHEVRGARWDAARQRWQIDTAHGRATADILVLGQGGLSDPAFPLIAGIDRFQGTAFHSAQWNHGHDLEGEKVAVIGTGASAIQFVPQIQPEVGSLTLFQRTPAWVLPHTDRPVRPVERKLYRRYPRLQKAVRYGVYVAREMFAIGLTRRPNLMKATEKMGLAHLHKQVTDPVLQKKLTPDYSAGCKRLLLSDDFYPSLNADNVEVVTDPILEVRESSIVTAGGVEHEVDTIIYGTGFRVTDQPIAPLIHGADGRSLAEVWTDTGPQAYLGTSIPGFPNLFMLAGPNTGIGHTSLVVMIEGQLRYFLDALDTMERRGIGTVDVRDDVYRRFNREIDRKMAPTVWSQGGCASWYIGANGRNSTLWPDFTFKFRLRTRRFDASAYRLEAPVDRGADRPRPDEVWAVAGPSAMSGYRPVSTSPEVVLDAQS